MTNHMEQNVQRLQFLSPTFTSYTDDESAITAARVAATSSYLEESDSDFEFDLLSLDDVSRIYGFPIFGSPVDHHVNGSYSSTSSSDGEEMYCVWQPRKSEVVTKRWKLLDLLRRCKGEGKGETVFLAPKRKERRSSGEAVKYKGSPAEVFYVRSRASKEGQKSKSYLPYKKDLVGFFR